MLVIMENEPKRTKIAILLMKYVEDKRWTATVPTLKGCLSEGETPEEATNNITEELKIVTSTYPETIKKLKNQPEYLLTEIEIDL